MRMTRRFDDANLWSGAYRLPNGRQPQALPPVVGAWGEGLPTLVVTVRLRNWSLPFSVTVGGHLLSKPGLTFGIGPVYISWSML